MQLCTDYHAVATFNSEQYAFDAKVFCGYTIYGRKRDILVQAFIDFYGTVQFRIGRANLMRGHKAYDENLPINRHYDVFQWGGVAPTYLIPSRTRLAKDLHDWCNKVLTDHATN